MIDKEVLAQVANGEVDNPRIAMTVEGNEVVAEGVHARYFALGILAGLKMAHPDSEVTTNNAIRD